MLVLNSFNLNSLLIILFSITACNTQFNQSVCGYIEFNSLYYFINAAQANANLRYVQASDNSTIIYNLCQYVEYYCAPQNNVAVGSLVKVINNQCIAFNQTQIQLINATNASQGIQVVYSPIMANTTQPNLTMIYACNGTVTIGCASVS